MSRTEALKAAEEAGVDLVEISPNANPPVAKIVDWGKFQYQKMKEQQKNRRSNKASELKQMGGDTVKITLRFRGREMAHKELGYELVERVVNLLEDDAILEQKPVMAGRNLSIVIRSK